MNNTRSTLAAVWRIAAPYFRSEDKWAGRGLLAAVVSLELGGVFLTVLFNRWNNVFYNALQERNQAVFWYQLGYFCVLATFWVGLKVYQLYLNQWLQIRWRRWMTGRYLGGWLHDANHYRMQLLGDAADNPDQRIADDTQRFVEQTLGLGIGLLGSVVTLASFVFILWGLSNDAPLHLFGNDIAIPGYLVWGALVYALLGTLLTHLIGIMRRTKKVTAFTSSYSQAAVIFPYILVAPAYFAEKIQLGGMMQTASAFGSVQDSLSFIITSYRTIAEWRSVVERLSGFETAIENAAALNVDRNIIHVKPDGKGPIDLDKLVVSLPNGTPLVAADSFSISGNERTLVTGPSGAGKSTLFRAIAGVWPFGSGSISIPAKATLMMLPQRPYFPVGSLKAAIVYPSEAGAFSSDRVRDVLIAVGMPQLAARLEEEAHWNRMLSLGEQQRLGLARALLHEPQYLFLDEATASLDEPSEAALYKLIEKKLPATTIVSIGHRSTLEAFHQRNVVLSRDGDRFELRNRKEEVKVP